MGLAVDAPEALRYDTFAITSDNRWKVFSIEKAKRILGFRPEDGAGDQYTPGPSPDSPD